MIDLKLISVSKEKTAKKSSR